jgi:hypothetical protein
MAMPGLPTGALALWVGVGDVLGVGDVFGVGDIARAGAVERVGELVRVGEIVLVGTIVRVGDMVEPAVGWREAGGGSVLAGTASVARTGPGQLSPAATATAAPSSAVTVKAPSERRTISRTRDPGTCYLPETPPDENLSDTLRIRR